MKHFNVLSKWFVQRKFISIIFVKNLLILCVSTAPFGRTINECWIDRQRMEVVPVHLWHPAIGSDRANCWDDSWFPFARPSLWSIFCCIPVDRKMVSNVNKCVRHHHINKFEWITSSLCSAWASNSFCSAWKSLSIAVSFFLSSISTDNRML